MTPSELINTLSASHPMGSLGTKTPATKREPFQAWSAIDDVKSKADNIAHEATGEFNVASQRAQEKTGKIEPGSFKYYAACTFGGLLACVSILEPVIGFYMGYLQIYICQGLTHTAVTPLDLIKCRRQVDSKLYQSNLQAFRTIRAAEGIRGVFTGWSPTFFGYSVSPR